MADEIRINGIAHSWGDTKLKIDGERFSGVTSVSFGDSLEEGKGYGMGKAHRPRARSRGKYNVDDLAMKVYASTAQAIRDKLSNAAGNDSYGMTIVPITLQYLAPDDTPMTIEFEECRLIGDKDSAEEGPDVLMTELTWSTMAIRRNGKTLFEE